MENIMTILPKGFSVTHNGEPLDPKFYKWNEKTRTFSSRKSDITIKYQNGHFCTFKTGKWCIFDTGRHNHFITGFGAVFFCTGPYTCVEYDLFNRFIICVHILNILIISCAVIHHLML